MTTVAQVAQWAILKRIDRLLGHWLLAAAIILIAAALSIPQLDRNAFGTDSRKQFVTSFGLPGKPYTPLDVLDAMYLDQQPLSQLLLHFWGYAAGQSVLAARYLFNFAALMSLAFVYRLVCDSVHPIAGAIAVFVALCLAKYSLYWAHIRYYSMVVMLAALILWLYLRIITSTTSAPIEPRRLDFVALAFACCSLLATHAFGLALMVAISLYHLIAVKKDRRWLQVVFVGIAILIIMSPLIYRMFTDGADFNVSKAQFADETTKVMSTWLVVFSNGNIWLVAAAATGAVLGWRRGVWRNNPFMLLILLLGASFALLSEASAVVNSRGMRYFLVGVPIVAGFVASGFYALYRLRRWLGLMAGLLWMLAGIHYLAATDWRDIASVRLGSYTRVPWHLVSRFALQTNEKLVGMSFGATYDDLSKSRGFIRKYYFGHYGISMHNRSALDIDGRIGDNKLERPGYWILFQRGITKPADMAIVRATLEKYDYEACDIQTFPNNTDLYTYRWKSLHCDAQPKATFYADAGAYLHYGARHVEAKLLFSGAWQPAADADPQDHNISFQLIDADWHSQAQIDLPIWSLSDERQFIIELADLPAGDYRLMAVVYDSQTGERLAWKGNEDWVPEMQRLAEIIIPERAADANVQN